MKKFLLGTVALAAFAAPAAAADLGARPYYKACKDSDGKLRVRCDSPHRLPNADCE